MSGKNWVLLVAGTKEWVNYRDQANVCCAYQIMNKHEILDDQIVVMMHDDIADNESNPFKGNIISVVDQSNVYQSVPKDYTGEDVTPENFLGVLQGHNTPGRKVITSGSQDNIFIYMSGTVINNAFELPSGLLLISDFIEAINSMSDNKQFSQMVIYVESTNSSSMFSDLSDTTNAYAVTSGGSNPSNYDPIRKVSLSDDFSAALLKFLSTNDYKKCTFKDLNGSINKNTKNCVNEFGKKVISSFNLSTFLENQ